MHCIVVQNSVAHFESVFGWLGGGRGACVCKSYCMDSLLLSKILKNNEKIIILLHKNQSYLDIKLLIQYFSRKQTNLEIKKSPRPMHLFWIPGADFLQYVHIPITLLWNVDFSDFCIAFCTDFFAIRIFVALPFLS